MIDLKATTERLRAYLTAPAATVNPDFHVSWDENNDAGSLFSFGNQDGVLNDTTPVEILSPPSGASIQKNAKQITVLNRDSAAVTVIFDYYDTVNSRWIARALLQPNWFVTYESCRGWAVYNGDGVPQGTGGGGGGDNITVNTAIATDANFSDATPAAPAGGVNVKWSKDASAPDNISAHLNPDDVSNTVLRNSAALSVIGRSPNSVGDPADIAATPASDAVLRESGSALGFGTVATGGIANNAVTDAKLRDSVALSVIGRAGAGTGDPADIASSADGQYLQRVAGALVWAALGILKMEAGRVLAASFASSGAPPRYRAAVVFAKTYTNPRVTLAWDYATKRLFTFESLTGTGMTIVSSDNSAIPGGSVHYHVVEEGAIP